jgi:hypothetical protein
MQTLIAVFLGALCIALICLISFLFGTFLIKVGISPTGFEHKIADGFFGLMLLIIVITICLCVGSLLLKSLGLLVPPGF